VAAALSTLLPFPPCELPPALGSAFIDRMIGTRRSVAQPAFAPYNSSKGAVIQVLPQLHARRA
jgi:hypothetical protein